MPLTHHISRDHGEAFFRNNKRENTPGNYNNKVPHRYHDVSNYASNLGYQSLPRADYIIENTWSVHIKCSNIEEMVNKIVDVIRSQLNLKPKEPT